MDKVWYVCFPISSYWFPSWLGLLGTEPVYLHLCAPHLDCFPAGLACEYKDEIRLVCVREGAVWIKSGKYNLWWNKLSGFIFGWQNGPAMPNIFGPCSHVFTIFFFFSNLVLICVGCPVKTRALIDGSFDHSQEDCQKIKSEIFDQEFQKDE